MTDEIPNHWIAEACFAGCKNYGLLKYLIGGTGEPEYDIKIRGFTNDKTTSETLTYKQIKKHVKLFGTKNSPLPITVPYPNSLRPKIKEGTVYTDKTYKKKYQAVVTKGIVNNDYVVLPFGYRRKYL